MVGKFSFVKNGEGDDERLNPRIEIFYKGLSLDQAKTLRQFQNIIEFGEREARLRQQKNDASVARQINGFHREIIARIKENGLLSAHQSQEFYAAVKVEALANLHIENKRKSIETARQSYLELGLPKWAASILSARLRQDNNERELD